MNIKCRLLRPGAGPGRAGLRVAAVRRTAAGAEFEA